MPTELQLKKVPDSVKTLIARQAQLHRRSINQEAIVLLEEALAARERRGPVSRGDIADILKRYEALPDVRPADAAIDYDDFGLPR
jgi:plasmid stability protein